MVASFTDLPPELWALIFHEYWSGSAGFVIDQSHTSDSVAANISGVCRKWRDIVLGMPTLWTLYTVRDPISDPESNREELLQSVVRRLVPLLPRAGSREVSIRFESLAQDEGGWMTGLLELISSRAESLHAASLIWVHTTDRPDPFFTLQTEPAFSEAPGLRRLTIGATGAVNLLSWPYFSLSGWDSLPRCLTVFRSLEAWMGLDDCLRVLRECPMIEECALALVEADSLFENPSFDPTNITPRMTLPNLHTLHLVFSELYPYLWYHITVPSLRTFSISAIHSEHDAWVARVNHAPFLALLKRSNPLLTSLALHFDFTDCSAEFIQILGLLSTLEELTMRFYIPHVAPFSEFRRLSEYLAYDPARPLPLPRLHTLCVDVTDYTVALVISRSNPTARAAHAPGVRLRDVTLYAPNGHLAPQWSAVEQLEANGVHVRVEEVAYCGGYTGEGTIKSFTEMERFSASYAAPRIARAS
ncbi:hypothetical protein DFH07DRAFT_1064499 [Mycena maculata]|uniref:F-box domain-containing protein n=1 Tax=Mycena maculata TaxID=230809 RepID=A0AAD7IC16_9AGAR|nr:hypothetical protein DFH07DRAFT_1064499 [Mycena maculata]